MKLAEALMIRAELKKEADNILKRATENAVLHDSEENLEDPNELLLKLKLCFEQLFDIEKKILKTNFLAPFNKEKSMYDALLEKDHLARIINKKNSFIESVKKNLKPIVYYEDLKQFEKTICLVDIKKLISEKDELERMYKQLNKQIQKKNWEIDVIE